MLNRRHVFSVLGVISAAALVVPVAPANAVTQPKIVGASIQFHTNNDDKDADTHVTTVVTSDDGEAVRGSGDYGHFNDHQNNTVRLPVSDPRISMSRLRETGRTCIRIDPNGNDTWKFNWDIEVVYSNGTHLTGGMAGVTLTQNNRQVCARFPG